MSTGPYSLADEPSSASTIALPAPGTALAAQRARPGVLIAFLAFCTIWMAGLGWLRWHDPGHTHGDPTTDCNILNGGENFDARGWWSSYGVPVIDTYRAEDHNSDYYTTYPPGAYWWHQVLKAVGVHSLPGFRIASIVVSTLAVLVLFALLVRVTGDAAPAAIACVLYLTSKPLVEYADALHYLSLSQMTLVATLYAWVRFEDAAERKAPRLSACWFAAAFVFFFMDSWLTFEHALFVSAVAALRVAWMRRWPWLMGVAVLASAPAIVLAVRILMNRAVLGSFEAVLQVMRGKFDQRTGSSATGTGFSALWDAWLPRLGAVNQLPADHPDREFGLVVLSWWFAIPAAALLMLAVASWHLPGFRPQRRMVGWGVLLCIGGLTWFGAMTEHGIAHRFTAMLILPGLAVFAAGLISSGLAQPELQPGRTSAAQPRVIVRFIGPVLGLFAAAVWIAELRSSFAVNSVVHADRSVREAIIRRKQAAESFARAADALKGARRMQMAAYDAPAARALGVPFDNTLARAAEWPPSISPGEALLAPLWTPDVQHRTVEAVGRLGFPDQVGPSTWPYVVFTPGSMSTQPANLVTRSGFRVERMEWRRTLDDRANILWLLLSRTDDDSAVATRLVMRRAGGQGAGKEIAAARVPEDGLVSGSRFLLRLVVPVDGPEANRPLELRAVVPGRPKLHGLIRADSDESNELPGGATLTDEGSLRWDHPPQPRARNQAAGAAEPRK